MTHHGGSLAPAFLNVNYVGGLILMIAQRRTPPYLPAECVIYVMDDPGGASDNMVSVGYVDHGEDLLIVSSAGGHRGTRRGS